MTSWPAHVLFGIPLLGVGAGIIASFFVGRLQRSLVQRELPEQLGSYIPEPVQTDEAGVVYHAAAHAAAKGSWSIATLTGATRKANITVRTITIHRMEDAAMDTGTDYSALGGSTVPSHCV